MNPGRDGCLHVRRLPLALPRRLPPLPLPRRLTPSLALPQPNGRRLTHFIYSVIRSGLRSTSLRTLLYAHCGLALPPSPPTRTGSANPPPPPSLMTEAVLAFDAGGTFHFPGWREESGSAGWRRGERRGLSKAAFVRGSLPAFPSLCARGGETEGAFWRDARRLVHLDPAAKALPLRGGKARPPFSLPPC